MERVLLLLMMDNLVSILSVMSHNTTGWSDDKAEILNIAYDTHNISLGFIQEHFQLEPNTYKIESKFENYDTFSLPAFKGNANIHKGRPSGGLSILYHKSIQNFVEHIIVPNSRRVHGVRVNLPDSKFVFINVYFPNDPRTAFYNDLVLIQTLQDIDFILSDCDNDQKVVIVGDFNTDLNRDSGFVHQVKQFLNEKDLKTVWTKFPIDFTYCQSVNRNGQRQFVTSTIDHFFVQEQFLNNCIDGDVLHFGENMSNHELIYLKINCQFQKSNMEVKSTKNKNIPNWKAAGPDQLESFKADVQGGLEELNIPDTALFCRDLQCQDEEHLDSIDKYTLEILKVLDSSVVCNIPKISDKTVNKSTPGWTEFVDPIRRDLAFWRSVWISAGKPINCQLHYVYRYVRRQYLYARRRIVKNEKEIRNSKFLQAAIKGDFNDILSTLRRQRRAKPSLTNTIDNVQGSDEIAQHFQTVYKDIFNKYDNSVELRDILHSINDNLTLKDVDWLSKITPDLMVRVINKLNKSKNDVAFSFKSDAFINSAEILSKPLAELFKSYLSHGYVPEICLSCTLIPLVKDNKKSKAHSSNYRLIAISSLILKLMDLLIIELFNIDLQVSTLQFGFITNSSTSLCSWTLKETINYFVNKGSTVYLCLLDMTKAFDNVKLHLLFNKVRERIPSIFVRFLIFSYVNQNCVVKWGESKSTSFTIGNGVRQGAVLSPILFNIYMNDVFKVLKESGIGCKIDNFYHGLIGYADDFALLCPSRQGLQQMTNLVEKFCTEHGITISINENLLKSKTKCISFNCPYDPINIELYNTQLPWVDSHLHLGHTISKNESTSPDIMKSRAELISNIHALYQELGAIHPQVFMLLVQVYFTSFYGSVIWDLDGESAHRIYATWNVMIRNAFNLPFATHRYILRSLSQRPPLQVSLCNRFRKFCTQIKNCRKPEVLNLFNKQKLDCRSTFGKNYNNIIILNKNYGKNYDVPKNCEWKVNMINELVLVRSCESQILEFTPDEIEVMLVDLCCS